MFVIRKIIFTKRIASLLMSYIHLWRAQRSLTHKRAASPPLLEQLFGNRDVQLLGTKGRTSLQYTLIWINVSHPK